MTKVITFSKDIDQMINDQNWTEIQKVLEKIIKHHETTLLPHYQKMEDYFNATTEILKRTKDDTSQPNNKLVNDYAGYITTVGAGFFVGSPVKYTVAEEYKEQLEQIQEVLDKNDEQVENLYLATESGHKGTTFELVYQDELSQTRFKELDAKQTVMVFNDSINAEPVFAVRYYKDSDIMVESDDIIHVEIYSVLYNVKLTLKKYKLDGSVPEVTENVFGEVQVIEYPNNKYRRGDFENVLTLINGYDTATSDEMNDIEYFSDAYLILKNLGGTDEEDITAMKKERVIYIENDGDAKFLVKDGNSEKTENMKDTLNENIHKFSHTPDLRDENFANNVSGVAMKYKLWGLEQKTTFKEAAFKKALQKRLRLISAIMNIKKVNEADRFDYSYINISFSRSLPVNWSEILEMVKGLQGFISDRTLMSYVPDITDVDYEIEMRDKDADNQGFRVDPYNVTKLPLTEEE